MYRVVRYINGEKRGNAAANLDKETAENYARWISEVVGKEVTNKKGEIEQREYVVEKIL